LRKYRPPSLPIRSPRPGFSGGPIPPPSIAIKVLLPASPDRSFPGSSNRRISVSHADRRASVRLPDEIAFIAPDAPVQTRRKRLQAPKNPMAEQSGFHAAIPRPGPCFPPLSKAFRVAGSLPSLTMSPPRSPRSRRSLAGAHPVQQNRAA
jgi:hypothetical protein